METCSVLLASQGNPFTEALLWLYRSHNLHSRVLDALKEDKSVAVGESMVVCLLLCCVVMLLLLVYVVCLSVLRFMRVFVLA